MNDHRVMRWMAPAFFGACLLLMGCNPDPQRGVGLGAWAAKGDTARVRLAVRNGAPIDEPDVNGYTPISVAAFNGKIETVRELLELGSNPDAGFAPLRPLPISAAQGNTEIVKLLLEKGAKVKYSPNEEQPITYASEPEIIKLLLEAGADINAQNGSDKMTCLHNAASLGKAKAVKMLLDLGANPKVSSGMGWTPLHMICRFRSVDLLPDGHKSVIATIQLLLKAKADPNAPDNNLSTPLHIAARNPVFGKEELKLLIDAGARKDLKNAFGRTPFMVAQANGFGRDMTRLAMLSQ